jgi:hypothetical protein
VTTYDGYTDQAKQKQKAKAKQKTVNKGSGDDGCVASGKVLGLAARNFSAAKVKFFLDIPFIEPRYGTDLIAKLNHSPVFTLSSSLSC